MSFRYTPAHESWVALVLDRRALLLGGTFDEALIDGAWSRLHEGAPALLELLTSRGLQATPPFALVEPTEGGVRIIVRGDATVTIGGESVTGAGAATWIERVLPEGALDVRVLGAEPTALPLPIAHGVVRTARLESLDAASMPRRHEAVPVAVSAGAPPAAPVAAPAVVPAAVPAAAHVSAPSIPSSSPAESTIMHDEIPPAADTGREAERESAEVADTVSPPAPDAEPDGYDYLFGATMYRSVSDAAVATESVDPESGGELPSGEPAKGDPETAGDHDGATMLVSKLNRPRGRGKREPAAAPESTARPLPVLTLPSGTRETLEAPLVLGRAPSVAGVPAGALPRLVPLSGGDQDLSRNHLRVEVQGETVVVTDLHSKNGTIVTLPGAAPVRLRGGEPTPVITGTVIELGGVVTLSIEDI